MIRVLIFTLLILICSNVIAETPTQLRKEPGVSLLLSLLITGGGQFYNGEVGKGVGFLFGEVVTIAMMISGFEDNLEHTITGEIWDVDDDDAIIALGFLMWAGLKVGSVFDAYISAVEINRERGHLSRINFRPIRRGILLTTRF